MTAIDPKIDSTIRAEFVSNAKKIYADLAAGDFAKEQNANLQDQLKSEKSKNTRLQTDLDQIRAKVSSMNDTVQKASDQLTKEARRRRGLQLEVWIWRTLAGLTFYGVVLK